MLTRRIAAQCLLISLIMAPFDVTAQNVDSHIVHNFISIGKHGELRDVRFIEQTFGVIFSLDNGSLVTGPYMVNTNVESNDIVVAIRLYPNKKIVLNGDLLYQIQANMYEVPPVTGAKSAIATVRAIFADESFCITPKSIFDELKADPIAVIGGTDGSETGTYIFRLFQSDYFEIQLMVDGSMPNSTKKVCSNRLVVQQLQK